MHTTKIITRINNPGRAEKVFEFVKAHDVNHQPKYYFNFTNIYYAIDRFGEFTDLDFFKKDYKQVTLNEFLEAVLRYKNNDEDQT